MAISEPIKQWYVLRDFKKWNAKAPAYKALPKLGVEIFTPMHWVVAERKETRLREYVPVIQGLLFAYDTLENLDPIIAKDHSLQYQFMRGSGRATPMTVPEAEMRRFMEAVKNDHSPVYFSPEELTPGMLGKEIIVNGGPLNGYHGRLLKLQGSKKKRVVVKIEGFIAAAVEINSNFIQFV